MARPDMRRSVVEQGFASRAAIAWVMVIIGVILVVVYLCGAGRGGHAKRPLWIPDLDPAVAARSAGAEPRAITDATQDGTRTWTAQIAGIVPPTAIAGFLGRMTEALRTQCANHADGTIEAWSDPRAPGLPVLVYAQAERSGRLELRYREGTAGVSTISAVFTANDLDPAELRSAP